MTGNRMIKHRFLDSRVPCRSLRPQSIERMSLTGNDVHIRHVERSVGLLLSEGLRSGVSDDHETNESPARGIAGRTWC
jgi:hypothetical protein